MSDNIQSYSLIFGKIVDSKGNPLSGVGVTLTLSGSSPTPKNYTYTSTNDGTFTYTFPTTDVDPKNTKLSFTKENFKVKSIDKIQETSKSEKDNKIEISYEIPRITMLPGPNLKKELQTQIEKDITDKNQEITTSQIKIGLQTKIASRITLKLENNKEVLLPYVINMISEFGPTVSQQVVNKNLDPNNLSSVTTCPLPATLEELINKRNKLVKQLNNSYNDILNLTKALNITDVIIKAIQVGLTLYQTNPYPSTGVPPLGLPPLTAGQIALINISVTLLQNLLSTANVNVDVLTISLGEYGYFLALLLEYLNQIDTLLQFCASQPPVTETTVGLTADQIQEIYALNAVNEATAANEAAANNGVIGAVGGKPAIPTALNFEQVNNQINALSNSLISTSQTPEGNIYKGFKLEIVINEKNTSQFIQRYAQALTTQGVPVLKTEPSFASDPQVLVNQLKFIIDSNPNITAQ